MDNESATPKGEANLETISQLGLLAVTRRHERGIPSNRVSSPHGEYVSAPCTHRPSLHPSVMQLKNGPWGHLELYNARGRSRNKVAVGEPAAGSPPQNSMGITHRTFFLFHIF